MKIYAFYLPQFHEIPENNKWWGKGFTEWTNIKKCRPLFTGHNQPLIPDNYYNLLDPKVLLNQSNLAKNYGIDGFCIYHYWFNGKKLLEKPAEILLKNKNIDISYFFSWANEPWTRSWDGKNKTILINQDYGNEEDWLTHISYLKLFFKDHRYKKIGNKPLICIYKPSRIINLEEMLMLWNREVKKMGFSGIHIINTLRNQNDDKRYNLFDASLQFEPTFTQYGKENLIIRFGKAIKGKLNKNYINIYDNEEVYMRSLNSLPRNKRNTYNGGFSSWDNSPRRTNKATIFKNFSLKSFESYIDKKFKISIEEYNSDLFFFNAWNEWAEGAFLEPDSKYGLEKLKIIKKIKTKYFG